MKNKFDIDSMDFLSSYSFMRNLYKEVLQQDKTPINQYETLLVIKNNPNLNVGEIGERLNISRPNITPIINNLFKNGFIDKVKKEKDTRSFIIKINKNGNKKLKDIDKLVNERLSQLYLNKISDSTIKEVYIKELNKSYNMLNNLIKGFQEDI